MSFCPSFTGKPVLELKTTVTVEVGGTVNESCRAIGNPIPKVYWLQQASGKPMSSVNHSSRYSIFSMIDRNIHVVAWNII